MNFKFPSLIRTGKGSLAAGRALRSESGAVNTLVPARQTGGPEGPARLRDRGVSCLKVLVAPHGNIKRSVFLYRRLCGVLIDQS